MTHLKHQRGLVALSLAFVAISTGPALAAGGAVGLHVFVQPWDPHKNTPGQTQAIVDDAHFFDRNVAQRWDIARDTICDELKKSLAKPNSVGKGMSLYNIDCAMGETGVLKILKSNSKGKSFVMNFHVAGNGLTATSTQPTILGSYADPRFSVGFDLDVSVDVSVLPIKVNSATVVVSKAVIDSHNFPADELIAADAFLHGGFLEKAQIAIDQTKSLDVTVFKGGIEQQNNLVGPLAEKYQYSNVWFMGDGIFADFAPVFPSTPRTAVAGGTIRWTKSSSITIDDCANFTMMSSAQTGPAPLTYPLATYGDVPTVPGLGTFAASGAPLDAGDHFECAYTLSQLPATLPETITGKAKGRMPKSNGNGFTGYYALAMSHVAWEDGVSIDGRKDGLDWDVTIAHINVGASKPVSGNGRYNPVDPAIRVIDTSRYENGGPSERGITLVRSGDLVGAAVQFAALTQANPSDAIALFNLGLVHIAQGQTSLAKTELASASRFASQSGNAALALKIDAQRKALSGAATQLRSGSVLIGH